MIPTFTVQATKCPKCGHQHAGRELASICIGCPCPERPEPQPQGDDTVKENPPPTSVTKAAVISVSTNVLEAVAKWTSPDDSRPHIRQVLFSKGVMVALDGIRMVIAPCETFGMTLGVDRDYLFAAVAAQRALKVDRPHLITLEPGPTSTPALADGPSTVRLGIGPGDGTRRVSIVAPAAHARNFPDYEFVVKRNTSAESDSPVGYGLNPAYLAAIADVHYATTSGGGASEGVKLVAWSKDFLGAMVFESTVGVKFFVMPMRI